MENGYTKREVRKAIKEKQPTNEDEKTEEPTICGVALMPNITEFKIRDLTSKLKTLGDKTSNIVYNPIQNSIQMW